MNLNRTALGTALVLSNIVLAACGVPDADRSSRTDAAFLRLVAAEDARPSSGRPLAVLTDGTKDASVFLRRVAVRALGRLENPDLAPDIEPLLDDPAPDVRAEAANALAQAFFTGSGDEAMPALERRLEVEADPSVRGTLAQSLGRLQLTDENRVRVSDVLVGVSRLGDRDAPPETMVGVALGSEALIRGSRGNAVAPALARRLVQLSTYEGLSRQDPAGARVRALAVLALGQAGRLNRTLMERTYRDQSHQLGGVGVRFFDAIIPDFQPELLRRAIGAESPFTVLEAFRVVARRPRDARNCLYLFQGGMITPPEAPAPLAVGIRVTAIDALAQPCPDIAGQRSLLLDVVNSIDADPVAWQPAAHALVSLASIAPSDATTALPRFLGHPNPFVRTYAARAARVLGNESVLQALLADDAPNVRTAALQALFALSGRSNDRAAIDQLAINDPQLLMTAAQFLEGSPLATEAAEPLLAAFERTSAERRETWRDARRALVARLAELGNPSQSERMIPYLSDYDAVVAEDVARLLRDWNGRPYFATPAPLPRAALPTASALRQMDSSQIVLHMQGGGEISIELHPYVSPTNTWRFFRLVGEGHFDGLTFHRWAPNFVIQGGSPNANEFYGDAAFSRDEVGPHHWRGTVGISTRGHDTGDGQIFVNLMDNVRLDHTYTIVGTVVEGLDVVDGVFEGGVIERAEVRESR